MPAPRGPIFVIAALDSAGEIQGVEIDANDHLKVVAGLSAYNAQYIQRVTGTGDGGNVNLDGDTVPAGQIWVVTSILALDATSALSSLEFGILAGGVHFQLRRKVSPAAGEEVDWQGQIAMIEDDFLRATCFGTTVADSLALNLLGYKILVP